MNQPMITIIGLGALGSRTAYLLAQHNLPITIIDRDIIDRTNLEHQPFYTKKDLGKSKALVLQKKLQELHPQGIIIAHDENLDSSTLHLIQGNIIIDGTDNMYTRFLINDYAKKNHKTWIYGSVLGNEGYCYVTQPGKPCYECIYHNKTTHDTCATRGVNNDVATAISILQTTLAQRIIKKLVVPEELTYINTVNNTIKHYPVKKNPSCNACSKKYVYLNQPFPITTFCGTNTYQLRGNYTLKKQLHPAIIHLTPTRVLIKARTEKEALSIHAKYLGH
ncbi:MAG TPA: ThiF family adenylyltransferase [Candidatus Nanoarchaeia archaeon]|nr:ThiF family adenylyltransferase [Candidatus Nanoarchaeia archaeon]